MMEYFTQAFEWAKANDNMLGAVGSTLAILTLFITNGALIMRKLFGRAAEGTPESIPSINYKADAPDYGDTPAVACLPFTDRGLSDDSFADGLLDDVISHVQRYQAIAASSRTTVEEFRDSKSDVRRIARSLGVGYILEGSLRQGSGKIRLNIQLLDHKGATRWSDRFDADVEGGIDAQDKFASDIAKAIHDVLVPVAPPEPVEGVKPVKVAAEITTPVVATKVFQAKEKARDWQAETERAIESITDGIKTATVKATAAAKEAHGKLDPETAKFAKDIAAQVGLSADGEPQASKKIRSVAILLCLLGFVPGVGGLHRFYVGRPWTGLLYIFTLGLFYVGTLLDLIVLISGAFGDGKGHPVTFWTKKERNAIMLSAKE